MQIVHGDEVPIDKGNVGVRTGTVGKQIMLRGEPGPGYFKFTLAHQYGDFQSPRHRHNFTQIRVQLEGECKYGAMGKMTPGTVGYFPEGVHYGPQGPDVGVTYTAALQFGGPSGSGMVTSEELAAAKRELSKIGIFKDGVFRRNDDVAGKRNVDGFQAIWEQVNRRALVYPEAQYSTPIFMKPEAYRWMSVAGAEGVSEKALGTFTDCKTACSIYQLRAGAEFTASSRGIFFVLSGNGSAEKDGYRKYTGIYLDSGEKIQFRANEISEIIFMGMPDVAAMRKPLPEHALNQAAE